MNRVTYTLLGFFLALFGFLSLLLSLIGLRLWPISYIDKISSPIVALLIKLVMIIAGIILFYMSRINRDEVD